MCRWHGRHWKTRSKNNAHEVHSYLHLDTGEVIRVVDGVADPAMHNRIMSDRTLYACRFGFLS